MLWKSACDAACPVTTAVGVGSAACTLTPALMARNLRRSSDQERRPSGHAHCPDAGYRGDRTGVAAGPDDWGDRRRPPRS